jgi:hypothetical protein
MIGDYDGRPFLLPLCVAVAKQRLSGRPPLRFKVDWGDAVVELIARVIVGAIIGAVGCFLSFRLLFWPGRSGRPSVMDQLGWGEWPHRVFIAIMVISIAYFVLNSRARTRPIQNSSHENSTTDAQPK